MSEENDDVSTPETERRSSLAQQLPLRPRRLRGGAGRGEAVGGGSTRAPPLPPRARALGARAWPGGGGGGLPAERAEHVHGVKGAAACRGLEGGMAGGHPLVDGTAAVLRPLKAALEPRARHRLPRRAHESRALRAVFPLVAGGQPLLHRGEAAALRPLEAVLQAAAGLLLAGGAASRRALGAPLPGRAR
eukprot:CAMPEP_0182852234 /NCGR_PEP_ID=MMETSP0034_2-20130328/54_1 /TAXON_ID=156128 /ORGANISM="Nephroselmis pyriformis, Strain CCMP717" /LENGTH=189 /DNA_ID=CAMNT_0024982931 /DNA_START=90 /DNA_END=657 /DNA_ORIENTATION=-